MKHFVVTISAGSHDFDLKCSNINEAFFALFDASVSFGIHIDFDDLMEKLVDMKRGQLSSTKSTLFSVRMADGEV